MDLDIVKLTFKADAIPYNISLFDSILCKVFNYIPNPFFCNKCLNYGHTSKRCRSNVTRCATCAKSFEGVHDCENKESCKFCGLGHKTNFMKCNERYRQKQIREYMIMNKLSFWEAKNKLFGSKQTVPNQADFNNDKIPFNRVLSSNIEHPDIRKINILNDIVITLKQEMKKKRRDSQQDPRVYR